jgi:tetratricopeptide (TPR) repeat protein
MGVPYQRWQEEQDLAGISNVVELLGFFPLAIRLAAAYVGRRKQTTGDLKAELQEASRKGLLGQQGDIVSSASTTSFMCRQTFLTLTSTERVQFASLGLLDGTDWPVWLVELFLNNAELVVRARELQHQNVNPDALVSVPPAKATPGDLHTLKSLSLVTITAVRSEALPTSSAANSATAISSNTVASVQMHRPVATVAKEYWHLLAKDHPALREVVVLAAIEAAREFISRFRFDFAVLNRHQQVLIGAIESATEVSGAFQSCMATIDLLGPYIDSGYHWELGLTLLSRKLRMYHEMNNRQGECRTLITLGSLANSLGRLEEALGFLEQALSIQHEVGDREGEGTTLNNLGLLANSLGQYERARQYLEQALSIQHEVGDREGEGTTLNLLGLLADRAGDYEAAQQYYEQALGIVSELGDATYAGIVADNLRGVTEVIAAAQRASTHLGTVATATSQPGQVLFARRKQS